MICPANSVLSASSCVCVANYVPTRSSFSPDACFLNPVSMAGHGGDSFALTLDAAGAVWAFGATGSSDIFGASASFRHPTLLTSNLVDTSIPGVLAVPATPAGASVIAVSAGQSCGCILYSDTSAGCFGDSNYYNLFFGFINSGSYVTDGSGEVLMGIQQIAAAVGPPGLKAAGGILILREFNGTAGVVTYLISHGNAGNVVDGDNNVIDPISTRNPLQGAVQVAQGSHLHCALMGPQYPVPNAVVCFSFSGTLMLGATPTLDPVTYPAGPSLIYMEEYGSPISASSISVGYAHACAVLTTTINPQVSCWGLNGWGQLAGTPVAGIAVSPSPVSNVATMTFPSSYVLSIYSVSCGYAHTCIVLTNTGYKSGLVRCWGQDGTAGANAASSYTLAQDLVYSGGAQSGTALTDVWSLSAGSFAACVTLGAKESVACE